MPRISASDRLRRLLALIPWLAAHPGASIDEICARFEIGPDQLRADLEVVWMVGLPPYTPDQLIDVVIEDDRVWLHLGDFFASPLRLTADQAVSLVAAGSTLATTPGADPEGPLARGLAKLASSLGLGTDEPMDIHLGDADPSTLEQVRSAAADRRTIEIDYYSHGRDERSSRRIDPYRVFADQGQWYVNARCHRAGGERVFRIDRISAVRRTDAHFDDPGARAPERLDFEPDGVRVHLLLRPTVRWVVDQYPTIAVEDHPDGTTTAVLGVETLPWLERLLLRLGPEAAVVTVEGAALDGEAVRRGAARRVLARYRGDQAGAAPASHGTGTVSP